VQQLIYNPDRIAGDDDGAKHKRENVFGMVDDDEREGDAGADPSQKACEPIPVLSRALAKH
jgi:hypothetical protein